MTNAVSVGIRVGVHRAVMSPTPNAPNGVEYPKEYIFPLDPSDTRIQFDYSAQNGLTSDDGEGFASRDRNDAQSGKMAPHKGWGL